jgi:hypothetical protein
MRKVALHNACCLVDLVPGGLRASFGPDVKVHADLGWDLSATFVIICDRWICYGNKGAMAWEKNAWLLTYIVA